MLLYELLNKKMFSQQIKTHIFFEIIVFKFVLLDQCRFKIHTYYDSEKSFSMKKNIRVIYLTILV